jgi:hypothetical protein
MRIKLRPAQFALYALLILPSIIVANDSTSKPCTQSEWDDYFDLIRGHVRSFWKPPMNYRAISCTILVRQDFRQEVEHVEILSCDQDASVRKSAEDAGYAASPLPGPENRSCFSKQMTVRLVFNP